MISGRGSHQALRRLLRDHLQTLWTLHQHASTSTQYLQVWVVDEGHIERYDGYFEDFRDDLHKEIAEELDEEERQATAKAAERAAAKAAAAAGKKK